MLTANKIYTLLFKDKKNCLTFVCSSTTRTQSAVTRSCIRFFFPEPTWRNATKQALSGKKVNEYTTHLSVQANQKRRYGIKVKTINSRRASAQEDPVLAFVKSARNLKTAIAKAHLFYLSKGFGAYLRSPWFSHLNGSHILKQQYVFQLMWNWFSSSKLSNLRFTTTLQPKWTPHKKFNSPSLESLRLHCELYSCRFPRFVA